MTKYFTGITGITEYSPAISVSRNQELLSYSYYYGGKYSIYSAEIKDFKPFEVNIDSINFDVATPCTLKADRLIYVDKHLIDRVEMPLASQDSFSDYSIPPSI